MGHDRCSVDLQMRFALLVMLLVGCEVPVRSRSFACDTTSDCDGDRVCEQGFCVRPGGGEGEVDAARTGTIDAAPSIDAPAIDADPFSTVAPMCMATGYTSTAGLSSLYRSVGTGKSWLDAQADCSDDVAGATHLIVLSSTAEVSFMASQLGWVGLSDRATEGTFVTVTGETGDQRPFASGQPDNGGGSEDCVQLKSGGRLDDDQCGNSHRYVCECDGRPSI